MKLLNFLVIFSLSTSPLFAHAGAPQDQANETVEASQQQANAKASEAIAGDFNYALAQVMTSLVAKPDTAAVVSTLVQKQSSLLAQLQTLSSLDAGQVAAVKQKALDAFEQYKQVTREKFDLSFQAAAIRENERDSLRVAVAALQQFNSNCASGKGIGGLGESAFKYPDLPRADIGFSIGTNGFDIHDNGTGTQGEKNRSTVTNISGTIAGTVAAYAYLPTALTGVSASSVAVCAAAAPYTLGAGLVIAAAMTYINMQERLKMENEIEDAKVFAFDHAANDRDIARYYREQCSDMSSRTKPLIVALLAAINSPDTLETFAGKEDFVAEMDQLNAAANKRADLAKQLKALSSAKDDASRKLAQALATQLQDLETQIAKISTPEHVAKMAVQILISQRDGLTKSASESAAELLDLAQRRAFQKIVTIIDLVQQKEFSKFLTGSDEIAVEIAASKEFSNARLLFKMTLAAQIKAIFGYLTQTELQQTQQRLISATKTLIAKYPRANDVKSFMSAVSQLLGGL